MLREEFSTDSAEVGMVDEGVVVHALETRMNAEGVVRVRCKRGWLSEASATGKVFLRPSEEVLADAPL